MDCPAQPRHLLSVALALYSFLSEVTTFVRSKLKQDQDRSGKWEEGGEERIGGGGD